MRAIVCVIGLSALFTSSDTLLREKECPKPSYALFTSSAEISVSQNYKQIYFVVFGQWILTLGYLDEMHTNASDKLCDSIVVASSDASLFEQVLAESCVADT